MASPREALKYLLRNDAPLVALIADRSHYGITPQDNGGYPYVRFSCVSSDPNRTYGNKSPQFTQRWQFDVFADDAKTAEDVREKLRVLLNSTFRLVTIGDGSARQILGSHVASEMEPMLDPDRSKWRAITDFMITFGRDD